MCFAGRVNGAVAKVMEKGEGTSTLAAQQTAALTGSEITRQLD